MLKLDTLTFINVSCYCSMVILIMYRSAKLYSLFSGKTDSAYGPWCQAECRDIHAWQHMLYCRLFSFLFQLFLRLFFRDSIAERKSRKSTTKLHLMNLTNSLFVSNLDVEFRGTRMTLISGKYKYKAQVLQYKRMAILHSELGIWGVKI